MWMMLYLMTALANAEPKAKASPEGLLEVMQCVSVAQQLEKNSPGYSWSHVQGEYLKSGVAACTITLKKLNHEVMVTGTVEGGVFVVISDGQSWVALGGKNDHTLV